MSIKPILISCLVALLGASCTRETPAKPRPSYQVSEVVGLFSGTYRGVYFGGEEEFHINVDHTFSQTFKKNGVVLYQSSGSWEMVADGQGYRITFGPFMSLHRLRYYGDTEVPERIEWQHVQYGPGDEVINFGEGVDYQVVKEKAPK